MLTEDTLKIILEGYFEKHEIIFEGSYPINEKGQRMLMIQAFGKKGRFLMKMGDDFKLWCQSLSGKWFLIDSYRVEQEEK